MTPPETARKYIQDLRQHVGTPHRLEKSTIIVGTRKGPNHPMTVVGLTAVENQSQLQEVMTQLTAEITKLANSLFSDLTLPDDINGWRHQPKPITVKTIINCAQVTAIGSAAFNITMNSVHAPDPATTTLTAIPMIAAIAMMVTTMASRAQSDMERQKAAELIHRSQTFAKSDPPDVDCFTGQPDNGVYAGIVSIEVCRQMTQSANPKLW